VNNSREEFLPDPSPREVHMPSKDSLSSERKERSIMQMIWDTTMEVFQELTEVQSEETR
jgi:hypothetical protein